MKPALVLLLVVVCCVLVETVVSVPVYSYSASQYFGNGAFRTYFAVDNEIPVAIGAEWSGSFLHERPPASEMMMDMTSGHMEEVKLEIPLPDEAPVYTPFQTFETNYSPGHPAPYNETHFDYHFYFQNKAQRDSNITSGTCGGGGASRDSWCRGIAAFPDACCPPAYGNIGVVVPAMGAHLVDLMAPEKLPVDNPHYHPWVSQFTFGAWNGRISFYEIMIPISTFEKVVYEAYPKTCNVIRLPSEFPDPGFYPSMYCFWLTAAGNVRVELNTFVEFTTAGCKGPVDPKTTCSLLPGAVDTTTKQYKKHCECS